MMDDGVRTGTVAAGAPVVGWASGPLGVVQAADREIARQTAVRARSVAAAAARRLARALKGRGISRRPERAEGMAALTVVCTLPEARALHAALVQCADALVDEPGGPVRTRGQKMVHALMDPVLRPGESELPPVRVLPTIVASVATLLGGDAPAELDGDVLPAEMAGQLVRAFAGHDPTAIPDPAGPVEPAAAVPWQEAEQAQLAAWWDEMGARLLAGELDEPERLLERPSVDDRFASASIPCPTARTGPMR